LIALRKTMVDKRHDLRNRRTQLRKKHLPDHSEATVVRIFTEEPDGCRVVLINPNDNEGKTANAFLVLTDLVVCDLKGEFFPAAL